MVVDHQSVVDGGGLHGACSLRAMPRHGRGTTVLPDLRRPDPNVGNFRLGVVVQVQVTGHFSGEPQRCFYSAALGQDTPRVRAAAWRARENHLQF